MCRLYTYIGWKIHFIWDHTQMLRCVHSWIIRLYTLSFYPQICHMVLPCYVTKGDNCLSGSTTSPFLVQKCYCNYRSFGICPWVGSAKIICCFQFTMVHLTGSKNKGNVLLLISVLLFSTLVVSVKGPKISRASG